MSKQFASQTVVDDVSIEIQDGEFFSLLGPSGCGKTTLLRIVAGLESPTTGKLFWGDQRIEQLPPQSRPFNMVFQKYALFPHLSVYQNVEFGLKVKNINVASRSQRITEALDIVGLREFKNRKPETLSGGQAQRVALARAIVNQPKVLLLDEPLSALDQNMRTQMQAELRRIQRQLNIAFILVTHDQEEALSLSDRIAVMNAGRFEQVASPKNIYNQPSTHFVGQFVGSSGSLRGQAKIINSELTELKTSCGHIIKGLGQVNSAYAEAFIRPEKINIDATNRAVTSEVNEFFGEVKHVAFKGFYYEVHISSNANQLRVCLTQDQFPLGLAGGQKIRVHFSPMDTFIFSSSSTLKQEIRGLN